MANTITSFGKLRAVYRGSDMQFIENVKIELGTVDTEFEVAPARPGYGIALLQISFVEGTAANIEWRFLKSGLTWATDTSTLLARWELQSNQAPNLRLGLPFLWTPVEVSETDKSPYSLGMNSSAAITLFNLTFGYFRHLQVGE